MPRQRGFPVSRFRAALRRRERVSPARRAGFDARLMDTAAHPLGIVYTDTADFTHRAARDGIVHFLMAFERAQRAVQPAIRACGGRLVKVEADSLLLVFPDAATACRGVDGMERAIRGANRGRPDDECVIFSYGIGWGSVLDLEEDVFGLEVNLASKLGEDLARPGEVLLTPAAAAALPRSLARRLEEYRQVGFAGMPMSVQRLMPRAR
jgi:class 3 adenylate cyclase